MAEGIGTAPRPASQPVAQEMSRGGRLTIVDMLRGAACLWVLLYHGHLLWMEEAPAAGNWLLEPLVLTASLGYLGVHLFLVLSGFCLYYPLARRFAPREARLEAREFFRRRLGRILPPYYFALLLFGALLLIPGCRAWMHELRGWGDVLLHLVLLHNLSPETIFSVNPAFWSLALEFQLYLIFPLLVWGVREHGFRRVLAVLFLVSVAWQCCLWLRLGWSGGMQTTIAAYYALPGRCFEFALGMLAAERVVRPHLDLERRWRAMALLTLPIAVAYAVLTHPYGVLRDQMWGGIFAGLVVWLCGSAAPKPRMQGMSACLSWLGGISYSIYLVHQPLLELSRPWIHPMGLSLPVQYLVFGSVALPLLVAAGFAFHLLFERPFMRTGVNRSVGAPAGEPGAAMPGGSARDSGRAGAVHPAGSRP